jgi:F0F1-type ATP synthase assembly protein I
MSSQNNNENRETELTPAEKQAQGFSAQFAMAMELPFIIVSAVVVGGAIGFFLDHWLHTTPILMLVVGAHGFFAGLRDVLGRVKKAK